jgi:hypothetical protein
MVGMMVPLLALLLRTAGRAGAPLAKATTMGAVMEVVMEVVATMMGKSPWMRRKRGSRTCGSAKIARSGQRS